MKHCFVMRVFSEENFLVLTRKMRKTRWKTVFKKTRDIKVSFKLVFNLQHCFPLKQIVSQELNLSFLTSTYMIALREGTLNRDDVFNDITKHYIYDYDYRGKFVSNWHTFCNHFFLHGIRSISACWHLQIDGNTSSPFRASFWWYELDTSTYKTLLFLERWCSKYLIHLHSLFSTKKLAIRYFNKIYGSGLYFDCTIGCSHTYYMEWEVNPVHEWNSALNRMETY